MKPDARPAWVDGWNPLARHHPSPNFGPRPAGTQVDLIVLHSISLPPGEYGGAAVLDLFSNQLDWAAHPYYRQIQGLEVSAHFFIRRDGTVWQMVSCDARAWHAGQSSFCGRTNCNDYSIGIELEGLEGHSFAPEQYAPLARLCTDLRHEYPITHVTSHSHIAPERKFDPGAGFDWAYLQRLTAWPNERFIA